MGLLDFLRDTGRDLFGGKTGDEAASIKSEIEKELGNNIRKLGVVYDEGKVALHGEATSHAAKEKAVLIAGNVRGVSSVNDNSLQVVGEAGPANYQANYYTIKSGDTLSGIAKEHYGDTNRWDELFEANREVIKDPDKIYPGQRIRIPRS